MARQLYQGLLRHVRQEVDLKGLESLSTEVGYHGDAGNVNLRLCLVLPTNIL